MHCADNNHGTPLSWAAGSGQVEVVSLLLDEGAQHDSKNKSDRSPLSWAAANGSEERVSLLLKQGADLDHTDNNRRTPLSWAAGEGHLSVVKQLLAYKLDKQKLVPSEVKDGSKAMRDPVSGKESRPAKDAAIRSTTKNTKKKAKTVEVNSRDTKSWTPLCHAAFNGHKTVVETLL
ncbi:hypothetical protein FALCPG4_016718 [Fusarium falciforme]